MTDYKVTDTQLSSIADAIRLKGSTSAPLSFPDGFVDAVSAIPTSGITPTGSLSISQNGTYDVTSFASAVVSVAGGGGGSNDNFLIAVGAMDGIVYDSEATLIGSYAFYSNQYLTGVEMTNVSQISRYAFTYCYQLSTAIFQSCNAVLQEAFSACSVLENISFPTCETIGYRAFKNCKNITSASFPNCKTISDSAFVSCTRLTTVICPSCTAIGDKIFGGCASLGLISFASLTSINRNDAFASLANLQSAYFPACTSIYQNAFLDCTLLSDISFPELVTITPYASTASSYGTFRSTAITNVIFPKLESLGANTFQSCTKLSVVSLPVCSFIGRFAFRGCTSLASLYLLSESVASLANIDAFGLTPMSVSSYLGDFGSIFVPVSLVDSYKAATNWSTFADRITAYIE